MLRALNGEAPLWAGVDRVAVMVPPESGPLAEVLSRAAKVVDEKSETTPAVVHTMTLALRFEADGPDRWRVTIVKIRYGRTGIAFHAGLSPAGRWGRR